VDQSASMRIVTLACVLSIAATGALAQSRPMTPTLSCTQARALVMSEGGIVLGTGTVTYDRYVRSPVFCLRTETTEFAWVPTRDVAQCPVGYRCIDREEMFDSR
jgi:hypothetical protein